MVGLGHPDRCITFRFAHLYSPSSGDSRLSVSNSDLPSPILRPSPSHCLSLSWICFDASLHLCRGIPWYLLSYVFRRLSPDSK